MKNNRLLKSVKHGDVEVICDQDSFWQGFTMWIRKREVESEARQTKKNRNRYHHIYRHWKQRKRSLKSH